jgi:hypothetical protein
MIGRIIKNALNSLPAAISSVIIGHFQRSRAEIEMSAVGTISG